MGLHCRAQIPALVDDGTGIFGAEGAVYLSCVNTWFDCLALLQGKVSRSNRLWQLNVIGRSTICGQDAFVWVGLGQVPLSIMLARRFALPGTLQYAMFCSK
ncbi:hypothetical protein OPQ81_000694 [Rhizoctonia solani]|nr:hypothetical protein OPQ81_000694 [Rhizoctonia solani]